MQSALPVHVGLLLRIKDVRARPSGLKELLSVDMENFTTTISMEKMGQAILIKLISIA